MEIAWIEDFLVLAATRNFTRAAELRHTTQPAYSRRIARLEEWLGSALFLRSTRPVELTPQGEEFLTRAKALKADMMDAQRAVRVMDSVYESPLRLYTTNTLAVSFLPKIMPKLQDRAGNRALSILVASVTGCQDALVEGRADMILIPSFGDEGGTKEIVGHDSLALMVAESQKHSVKLGKGVLSGKVMMYPPSTRYGQMVKDIFIQKGITLESPPVCESASAEALVALVKAGFGAAFLPQSLAEQYGITHCLHGLKMDYKIILLDRR